MTTDVLNLTLPKWPALVVQGDPVSAQQAMEILVRTDSWRLMTNDAEFEAEIAAALNLPYDGWTLDPKGMDAWRSMLVVLPLNYLCNERIASIAWKGPHGWCSWDGAIEARGYSVGKWPEVQAVLDEWQTIAAAFPYLRLTAQLWDWSSENEDHDRPLVEYTIAHGEVSVHEPRIDIGRPKRGTKDAVTLERGVTVEHLRKAVDHVIAQRRHP